MATVALRTTFAALSDPTRLRILERLRGGESTVGELAEPFDMSLNAVSKHLQVLEGAGLIRRRIEGRVHRIALDPRPLAEVANWAEDYRAFWEDRLDALASYLRERPRGKRRRP